MCLTIFRMSLPRAQAEVLSTFIFLMKKPSGMESITDSMNFDHSLSLFVAHYLLQSLRGICKTLRLMLECWRGWDGNNWTCNNLSCCSSMHFFSGLSAGRSGLSLGVHAILQLVCLRQERHLEWRMCCRPVSYMNARAGKSFWPALCHSDFGACCDSCVLVSVASNCLPDSSKQKSLK